MEQTTSEAGRSSSPGQALPDDWCLRHFDHLSPELAATLPDTIDGNPSIIMSGAGQRLTLNPANDGVNSGWSL